MGLRALAICGAIGVVLGCGGAPGGGTGEAAGLGGQGGAGGSGAGGGRADASADGVLAACGTSHDPSSGLSCNTVAANGPCVTETVGRSSPPAAVGGTIVAGTYDLVASTVYPYPDAGADAAVTVDQGPRRQTVVVSGSGTTLTMESALVSGTEVQRLNVKLIPSGSSVTLAPTCPFYDGGQNPVATVQYSAIASSSATTIVLFDALNLDHLQVDEYLKR